MKSDIDHLMEINNVDVLFVTGRGDHNPPMVYLTGGGHLTEADYIKKKGEAAVVFHGPMERDEAARTGLKTKSFSDYPMKPLLEQAQGDFVLAHAMRYQMMLRDLGIDSGRVALYGITEIGKTFTVLSVLTDLMPGIEFVYNPREDLLRQAMATKDETEIERIRNMGKITTEVVGLTAEFLCSHGAKDGHLVKKDGQPLTIGEVKSRINLWLTERGAENPEGTIFAIGRDAGVPHSSGKATDLLNLGETIVYDIFPCEAGGGYFYDFTRTWSLGFAKDEVVSLYEQVHSVYQQVMAALKVNAPFSDSQRLTCDLFEALGHPTVKSNPTTEEGYVHSIGHGLGLNVHESPSSGWTAGSRDMLLPGTVITIEPGLYYPDKGMGVRLEDTVVVHQDGSMEILAPYPMNLVLPVKE